MAASMDMMDMKRRFNEEIHKLKLTKGKNTQLFSRDEYYSFLTKVQVTKDKIAGKTPGEYQRLSRYDIVKIGTVQKLIVPVKNDREPIQYYCYLEETFDIIHETHISIGHGGRNRMMKELKPKYKNITKEFVALYLTLCEPCQKKLSVPKKGLVVKPIKSSEFNSRFQVDLIDMQTQADNDLKKSSEGNQLDQPPEAPQLVLLPECRPDDGAEIKSEPDDQILQPVPECSSRNPEEYLPENPPIANHAKDVAKQSIPKRHFGKVVCRMCLESAAKTQMVPLTTWDVNYAGRSEAYKQNKILQTERVNSMINVVMPNFDFDIAYNPMICHKCVARLESAFNFIEECKESEKVIHSYKTKFASHQELVSCDDVAQNRRLLEKEESRRKRRKSSKQHDNDRLVTSSPLGQNESISAGDTSQVEVHEFERVDCGESQESITMETNSEIMTSIKSEREDLECDDSEGNSFLINTADLTSVIVKEEVSVKEEVPCDFNDLPTNDQHCDLIVKDEAYSLTIAYGTDENDEYHRDSALSRKRKEMDPGT
ncbi:uncharacterized protein isoform X4 [Leptinotarsa decemlineata]|uniref:uncharacterized protein isoform X4 n=1 Tax=Leptinotarsa decemlineata TaxID=7539 RepID=UPI003D30AC89